MRKFIIDKQGNKCVINCPEGSGDLSFDNTEIEKDLSKLKDEDFKKIFNKPYKYKIKKK